MFNLASMLSKKREPAGASMDPGIDKMMELEKMTRLKARLPSPEDIAEALRNFTAYKSRERHAITDNQAQLFLQSLRYCLRCEAERNADGQNVPFILSRATLKASASLLRYPTKPLQDSHVELCKKLHEVSTSGPRSDVVIARIAGLAYIRTLALTASPEDALAAFNEYESVDKRSAAQSRAIASEQMEGAADQATMRIQRDHVGNEQSGDADVAGVLATVLKAFVDQGQQGRVNTVLTMLKERGPLGRGPATVMQDHCLLHNDFPSALQWWREGRLAPSVTKNPQVAAEASAKATQRLLDWCLEHGNIEDGHQIVQELTASNPTKFDWDVIFVWAAGTKKGVDEIDRMIGVMVKSNESIEDSSQWRLPDVATINGLVEFAISRDDPYMAERFIALGRDRDIQPDAKTYVLQMDYRLQVGDVNGALIAYKNLQEMDLSSNEDVATVNRLIVALCKTQRHDFDTIMNVAADLSDRRARFEPETVTTLCLLHLRRDERYDVIDLLNTHAYHFSSTERESIRNALVAFALDPETSTSRSWDAYTILRDLFDEMPRTQRTDLMTAFIRRARPDMGVHTFQNMRMHSRADTIPTIETYAAAFMALARQRELDSLEIVHNQLKLDFNVQADTYLLNAMIIAYTACGKPRHALDYWDEIAVSREGPSYNSVHVALRACEKAAFGDLKAQEIWSTLRKRGVELDQSLWASYVAALAGNGDNELAFRVVEDAVEAGEVEVDEFLLGSLFGAGANKEKQGEIEGWARERYPGVWAALEEKGVETDLVGMRRFGVDRSVAP